MINKIRKKEIVLSTALTMMVSMVPSPVMALATDGESLLKEFTNVSIEGESLIKGTTYASVDSKSLPKGFTSVSIGNSGVEEKSSFDSEGKNFTVVGSGNFIGKDLNSTDSYEFVNYKVEGDATITAKLVNFDMSNAQYGQAGVFMRSDNSTDNANYFGVYWDNKADQYRYAYRDNASEKTGAAAISNLTQDSKELYIRISKEGNSFRYTIAEDSSFTQVVSTNSQGVSCTDDTWYLGLVVSNGGSQNNAIATFSDIKIESSSKIYYDSSLDEQLLDTVENLNAASSDSKVTLAWSGIADAKNYVIKRATDPSGEFVEISTIDSKSTTYIDNDVNNFTTYYYKVIATNDEGKSNDSQVVMAMPNNSNPLNLQYEENAAVFNMTEEPNDTVLSSGITIKGSTNKNGTITIKQDDEVVYSNEISANEIFEQSFVLKEGRNVINIYQTTNSGETTLKTYNIVYLKKSSYDIVVDGSYTGDDGSLVNNKATFKTIQAAVDSVSKKNTERVTILVKNGVYKEKVTVESPYISIIGEDSENTVWTYDAANGTINPATGEKYGTSGSGSVTIKRKAVGFTAENITIENAFKEKGNENEQAVALRNLADQSIFVNCRFIGNQDTLLADADASYPARQYYYNCYIEGDVDFIFGRAQAVFDNCEIASLNRNSTYNNGYVTAADTWDKDSYGYLIINSRLVGLDNIADNTVSLGRPWRPSSQTEKMTPAVTYVNCYMGSHITSKGWDDMSATSLASTSRFYEFGSFGPGAKLSSTRNVLSLQESKSYTMLNIFAHNSAVKLNEQNNLENAYINDWNPTSSTDGINMNSLYIKNQDEEVINNAPIIEASDVTINEEDTFDPYANVVASDVEDGDITSSVTIKENNVDTTKPGEYKVVYEVKDSKGVSATKEIKVIVKEVVNNEPIIEASDVTINEGDTFAPYANVVASDVEDGDITSSVTIKENNVDTTKPGEYKVVYEVKDSKEASVTKEIKVTVLAKVQDESKLTINELRSKTSKVTGNGISGSIVKAYINGKEIGSATVSSKGTYSIKIAKQNPGTIIEVKMINKDNSVICKSIMVTDKFKKFKVNSVKASSTSIKGVGTVGASVNAYVDGVEIGSAIVDSDGNFEISIEPQSKDTKLTVQMTLVGYEDASKLITVKK